jgi:hypothetical protein
LHAVVHNDPVVVVDEGRLPLQSLLAVTRAHW